MRGCNPRCRFISNSGSLTMSEWSGGKTECHSCQMIGNTGQLWGNYQGADYFFSTMFVNNYYSSKPGYVCDAYGSGYSTQYFYPLPAWQADDGAATGVAGNNAYYYPGAPLKQTSGCGTVGTWTAMATTALSAHPDPLLPATCDELAVISPSLPGGVYQLYDGNGGFTATTCSFAPSPPPSPPPPSPPPPYFAPGFTCPFVCAGYF
jgi:hypothetical protein